MPTQRICSWNHSLVYTGSKYFAASDYTHKIFLKDIDIGKLCGILPFVNSK